MYICTYMHGICVVFKCLPTYHYCKLLQSPAHTGSGKGQPTTLGCPCPSRVLPNFFLTLPSRLFSWAGDTAWWVEGLSGIGGALGLISTTSRQKKCLFFCLCLNICHSQELSIKPLAFPSSLLTYAWVFIGGTWSARYNSGLFSYRFLLSVECYRKFGPGQALTWEKYFYLRKFGTPFKPYLEASAYWWGLMQSHSSMKRNSLAQLSSGGPMMCAGLEHCSCHVKTG